MASDPALPPKKHEEADGDGGHHPEGEWISPIPAKLWHVPRVPGAVPGACRRGKICISASVVVSVDDRVVFSGF